MKQAATYVGLDVHQATTVVAVREDTGRVIARTILPTDAPAILEYFRGMRGAVQVALEEGTQAQWLHDLLVPVVDRVVVCDRRGHVPRGNKDDQRDAEALAEALRRGGLRAVYHASSDRAALKEFARAYQALVEDATRVMLRLKALFRARGIKTPGRSVYRAAERATWLAQLPAPGVRFRAEALYAELEVLLTLRPKAKAALLAEAKRDAAWPVLRTVPFLGPVRVALLLATLQTPWRFRTKRHLWAYAGLAVVTRTSAEYTLHEGRPLRRQRAPMTRGLNRNHHRVVKNVLKSAATAATVRPGALQELYRDMLARGMREELARVTLTRKLAAVTLHVWKTGERYDSARLTRHAP
ncbi:MAG: IS110 family transposase [Gemmatimonadaceae bacterium]